MLNPVEERFGVMIADLQSGRVVFLPSWDDEREDDVDTAVADVV
jgi:hypothetical protein